MDYLFASFAASVARNSTSTSLETKQNRALHSLMLDRIDAVSAARDYAAVATSWSAHMAPSDAGYVLGRFIEEEVRPASDLHDYLDRIAKGSALAVAIFYRGHQIDRLSGAMRGLRVFFDTPLILSLLGYHKNEDQAAAEDVLRLVRDSGAQPSVFQHTCTETRNVLRGFVNDMRSAEHGQALESRMPVVERFVQSALAGVDQSKRRSRYLIDAERLPSILKERGFSVEQLPSSEHPTAQQEGLASLIRALYATEPASRTVEFDVKSVLGIYQIRSGRSFDSLDEAEAIFVTSNPRLVEAASTHFAGTLSRDNIPICYTSDVLANLLWLQHPLDLPGVPWRQVVAYMYAGLYPGEDLWHRYTHLLDEMRSGEPGISEEDYFILRFTIGARQALMDDTRGDPGLLTVGKISEILLRARDQLTSELQAELNSKESALAENLKRLSELRELVTEEERRRTVADAEVELIRRSIPIERWAAVQELLEMRSQAAARAARRTVEAIVVGSIALSVILSIISIRSGAIPPTSISMFVALLVAIASFLGYLNLKRGWNFDELERSVARRLTSLQVNRLSRTIRKRDETAPARQRGLR